jgi:hypothetical protein
MNIKKIIAGIMAIFAVIIIAVTFTACGNCYGDINDIEAEDSSESKEIIDGDYEVGGEIPGIEIDVPKNEQ